MSEDVTRARLTVLQLRNTHPRTHGQHRLHLIGLKMKTEGAKGGDLGGGGGRE